MVLLLGGMTIIRVELGVYYVEFPVGTIRDRGTQVNFDGYSLTLTEGIVKLQEQ